MHSYEFNLQKMGELSWFSEDFDSHFLTVFDWQCVVIEIHM
jgi:hypothetical protein